MKYRLEHEAHGGHGFDNQTEFAKLWGLPQSGVSNVLRGKRQQVRGWTLPGADNTPEEFLEGTVFESSNCGAFEILEYVSSTSIHIRFLATGYKKYTHAASIRSGSIKDPYHPTVQGIGYLGEGQKSTVDGKLTKPYKTWANMLRRCYNKKYKGHKYHSYMVCSVSVDWHCYQNFYNWYIMQPHAFEVGYELDKDILVKGNKEYGPTTCLLVTKEENSSKEHKNTTTHVFSRRKY